MVFRWYSNMLYRLTAQDAEKAITGCQSKGQVSYSRTKGVRNGPKQKRKKASFGLTCGLYFYLTKNSTQRRFIRYL